LGSNISDTIEGSRDIDLFRNKSIPQLAKLPTQNVLSPVFPGMVFTGAPAGVGAFAISGQRTTACTQEAGGRAAIGSRATTRPIIWRLSFTCGGRFIAEYRPREYTANIGSRKVPSNEYKNITDLVIIHQERIYFGLKFVYSF